MIKELSLIEGFEKFQGYFIDTNGNLFTTGRRNLGMLKMKTEISNTGYLRVSLERTVNGINYKKKASIHRLVALAFIPNIENKPEVNHINKDKTDNRTINLEWNTSSENKQHSKDEYKKAFREISPLSDEQIKYIQENCIPGDSIFGYSSIGRKFNVDKSIIKKYYLRRINESTI